MGKDFKKQTLPGNKSSKSGWKAVNPAEFSKVYNEAVPFYTELSEGVVVQLDTSNKHVKSWISKKIIVKE